MIRILLCALSASSLLAQNYIRIHSDSEGRDYTIDASQVAGSLKLVASGGPEEVSRWLYPHASAVPTETSFSAGINMASARFRFGGTVQQVTEYYRQILEAHGFRPSFEARKTGTNLTAVSSTETLVISVTAKSGYIEVRIAETRKRPRRTSPRRFEAVWYDDARGILRLRDVETRAEYELAKAVIVEKNLNRPGGVPSTEPMPAWLPLFPGVEKAQAGKIKWSRPVTAEFITRDSIMKVFEFYRDALERAGAQITHSHLTRSGDQTRVIAAFLSGVRGDDGVDIQIGEVIEIGLFTAGPSPDRVGIGIRYGVPLR